MRHLTVSLILAAEWVRAGSDLDQFTESGLPMLTEPELSEVAGHCRYLCDNDVDAPRSTEDLREKLATVREQGFPALLDASAYGGFGVLLAFDQEYELGTNNNWTDMRFVTEDEALRLFTIEGEIWND